MALVAIAGSSPSSTAAADEAMVQLPGRTDGAIDGDAALEEIELDGAQRRL